MPNQNSGNPPGSLSPEEAISALRRLHKRYVLSQGAHFRDVPFSAREVPGWTYYPKTDTVQKKHVA